MDETIVQQIVAELLSSLEPLETQTAALLQFLKAKGIATDAELVPFLEQAGNTSSVRWRAVQVRTAALISSAMKAEEELPAKAVGDGGPGGSGEKSEAREEKEKKNDGVETQAGRKTETGSQETQPEAEKKEPSPASPAEEESSAASAEKAGSPTPANQEDQGKEKNKPPESSPHPKDAAANENKPEAA